nr:hypothetical protein HK105_001747 [Polyrhizophydium stewartii]
MLTHAPQQGAPADAHAPSRPRPSTGASAAQSAAHHAPAADDAATPRLVISKIVQRNFKSYAGVVQIGPFHKSFTSIVGPNGSGKSNVIDSLLFVFGFKAKKMRQGRLADLIHNSARFPNLDSCSVEVHFEEIIDMFPQPGDDFQVVPDSQIVISRSVERPDSGDKKGEKSSYHINGRTSSYGQVTQLLKGKGVDLDHKRFLILQGEVESIALMKPKAQNEHEDGLLEYLEDIIGTAHYKDAIEESSKQLELISQEREEKLQRLKIIQAEKAGLEEKRKDAMEFIETQNSIVFYKNQLVQRDSAQAEAVMADLSEKLASMRKVAEEEKQAFAQQTADADRLEAAFKKSQKEFKQLEEEAKAAKQDLQKFDRAEIELKEKERHIGQKRKKAAKALEQDKHQLIEDETWVNNFDTDLSKAQSQLEELQTRLESEEAELEAIRQSLQGKTETFQRQIEEQQLKLVPWNEKINTARTELDVAREELELLTKAMGEGERALEAARAAVQAAEKSLAEKLSELAAVRAEQQASQAAVAKTQAKLERAKKDDATIKATLDVSRRKCDDGRLGDLGVIDDMYDVAVTTACGSLDAIVVETVETGQKCIEFLKRNNLGKATFICLDKLRAWNTSPIQTPENAKRLFDLITPKEPRFAPAFYQVLTDTLVADDLAQANRIAYGRRRYRVVTLQGQLIDTSGTMTGGGSKPQRGGMSSKFAQADAKEISPAKLAQYERDHEELEQAAHDTAARIAKYEHVLAQDQQVLRELDMQISKLEIDVASLQSQLSDAKSHLEASTNIQGPDPADVQRAAQLERTIKKTEPQLADHEAGAAKIQAQIAALQEQILEVGGVKLRTQNARVESLLDQIKMLQAKTTKLRAEKSSRTNSLRKLSKSVAKREAELESLDAETNEIKASLDSQSAAAHQVRQRVKAAQDHLEDMAEQFEKMKEARDEKVAELNASRSRQVELRTQITDVTQALSAKERGLRAAKEQLTKLSNELTGFEEDEERPKLPVYTPAELAELDFNHATKEIEHLEAHIKKLRPNFGILNEYRVKMELYMTRASDLDAVTARREEIKAQYDELRKRRLKEFMAGFTAISLKLKEMYQMITMGGNAELELVDSLDPFSEGVIFSVMPPKKSWKNIANLSGGEKTLSSLALVFALHHFKPTPLYVMDEIDAALDFRNVSIVANYIKQRTKNAQFVIISLRNNMFELADRLVGVYKVRRDDLSDD